MVTQSKLFKSHVKRTEHAGLIHRINGEIVLQFENRRLPAVWVVLDRKNKVVLLRDYKGENQVGFIEEQESVVKVTLNMQDYCDCVIKISQYGFGIIENDIQETVSREAFVEV